jgi:hypothetical protein
MRCAGLHLYLEKIQTRRGDGCHGNRLPPTGLDHHSKINKKTERVTFLLASLMRGHNLLLL